MTKYLAHVIRPGSNIIETYKFNTFKEKHKFECKKLYEGWTGVAGPDYPGTIEEESYEQLSLF